MAVMDISEREDYCDAGPDMMQPQENLNLAIDVLRKEADAAVTRMQSLDRAYKIALLVTKDEEASKGIGESMDRQIDIYSQCIMAIDVLTGKQGGD